MAVTRHISRPSAMGLNPPAAIGVSRRSPSPVLRGTSVTAAAAAGPRFGFSNARSPSPQKAVVITSQQNPPSTCPKFRDQRLSTSRIKLPCRMSSSPYAVGGNGPPMAGPEPVPTACPESPGPLPKQQLRQLSVPMLHFASERPDNSKPSEVDCSQEVATIKTLQHQGSLKVPAHVCRGVATLQGRTCQQNSTVFQKKPGIQINSHLVRSTASFEKYEVTGQVGHEFASAPASSITNSPAQRFSYPCSDNDSGDNKSPSEKHNAGWGRPTSTIQSDESLSAEQLKAYKELEQAEMHCELKRMENCLAEERERNEKLQQMFASELSDQQAAHSRDISALEDMIDKVLVENRRMSAMMVSVCGQAARQNGKASSEVTSPPSTCTSGNSSICSKRSPVQSGQSGSSGDETSSNGDSQHKDRALSDDSPHPMSSEAEHTTCSEQIPSSSDESPEVQPQADPIVQRASNLQARPEPETYVWID